VAEYFARNLSCLAEGATANREHARATKRPLLLQESEVQDGKFSLPKPVLGFLSCAFRFGLFSSCRTAHDPFWEFLISRFTVPFLKSLVRNLSLNQKLRKLSPLGFALKGHRSSSMTNGLYPAQARGKSCAVSRRNYVFASSKTQDRCEKRKDTRESQYNRTRKWDSFSAPFIKGSGDRRNALSGSLGFQLDLRHSLRAKVFSGAAASGDGYGNRLVLKRNKGVSTMKAKSQPDTAQQSISPFDLEEEVRRRAYELYAERGYVDGYEVEDWLQAEREVSERKG
jgi:hypothetical protein